MKTKVLLILSIIISSISYGQEKDSLSNNKHNKHWELAINLDLPKLNPEAIQICLFDFNPFEKYTKNFDLSYLNKVINEAKDENEKKIAKNSLISWEWDNLFKAVKGNDLSLLTRKGMILCQSSSGECIQKKFSYWLVSKSFLIDEKPYCFAVSFDFNFGDSLKVTFDNSKLISLNDLFDKIQK